MKYTVGWVHDGVEKAMFRAMRSIHKETDAFVSMIYVKISFNCEKWCHLRENGLGATSQRLFSFRGQSKSDEKRSSHKNQHVSETLYTTTRMNLFTTNHTPLLYGKDKPPVPDNLPLNQRGDFIRSSDDRLWLFQRQWIPSIPIIATLVILHGTVDHSGVYQELATVLTKAGIAVICTDMRGWGFSDGESYYMYDIQVFVEDVQDQCKRIQQQFPQVQHHFLLGKSIGGLIAAHACCDSKEMQHYVSGMIGLSGAFGIDPNMIPRGPVRMLLHSLNMAMPKLPLKPIMPASLLVSDTAAQEKWQEDPLVRRDRLTVGYLNELLRCTEQLEETLTESFPSDLPVLALWGTDDEVVTKQGHELVCGFSNCATLKTYSGGRHNLLSEPQLKMQVMNDICDWIVEICKGE